MALLLGMSGAPVDCNVERVAGRVAPDVAPVAWIGEVLDAAARWPSPLPEFHPGYVAISAVLDLGATRCEIGRAPRCAGCPLERWSLYEGCEYAARGPRQLEMWR